MVILIWDDAILVKIPMKTLTALVYKEEGVYVALVSGGWNCQPGGYN